MDIQAKIVVMPFGWERNKRNSEYSAFEQTLDDIAVPTAPRLLFAAASNGGANLRRTYPASQSSVFSIHASNHEGKRKGYNPTAIRDEMNYITIGHEVPGYDQSSRESGTSFATPVAAAIAAAIIEMMGLYGSPASKWTLEYLQTYDGMNRVFSKMSQRRDGYDYLDWADLFSEQRTDEEVCETISGWLRS
jgi:hypothetical protein